MAEKKVKKSALGKGLGSLFPDNAEDLIEEIKSEGPSDTIPLADIEPNKNQPRKSFDKEKLEALANSIKEHGIVSPIIVTPSKNGTYKIVAGERRWRAARLAGLREVPCIVKDFDEKEASEIALVENLQRDDLNPIEESDGYRYLIERFSLTQDEVAQKVGKSRSAVANSLRLSNLCDDVKKLVQEDKLTQGHARALLPLSDHKQIELAQRIIDGDLNVRQAEALVKSASTTQNKSLQKTSNPLTQKYNKELESTLSSRFGTKVKISEGSKKGKIEIEYYSKDDLERILFELKR